MPHNHREFSRTAVHSEVDILCGDTRIHGAISDLSVNGLFVHQRIPQASDTATISPGSDCAIELCLPGGDVRIHARGRIIRVTDDGLAVEIKEVDLDSYEHLCNLVRLHSEDVVQVEGEIKNHLGLKKPQSV